MRPRSRLDFSQVYFDGLIGEDLVIDGEVVWMVKKCALFSFPHHVCDSIGNYYILRCQQQVYH